MQRTTRRRLLALIVTAALVGAACGSEVTTVDSSAAPSVIAAGTSTSGGDNAGDTQPSEESTGGDSVEPSSSASHPVRTASTEPEVDDTLAPPPGPNAGLLLIVAGVSGGDVLNFRAQPDPSAAILSREAPSAEGPGRVIEATGGSRWHGSESWWEVTIDEEVAWANARFLAVAGRSYELGYTLNGLTVDTAFPAMELWDIVAERRFGSAVTGVVEIDSYADDAQTSQAWIDVIGTPVDGVMGERIHLVLRNLIDDEPKVVGFEVLSATGTLLCAADSPTDGRCDLPIDYAPPGCFFSIHQEQNCEAGGGTIDLERCECVPAGSV